MDEHTDVDQYDHNPEDGHPRSDGNGVGPEHQHSIDGLELVCDRDEVIEPISPADREASSRVNELVRPLHKGGWQRVPNIKQSTSTSFGERCESNSHDSHLTNTLRYRPDHGA